MPKSMTVQTAANELGVSTKHVYVLLRAGLLEAFNISESGHGGPQSLRVTRASIHSFIESRKIDPAEYFATEKNID